MFVKRDFFVVSLLKQFFSLSQEISIHALLQLRKQISIQKKTWRKVCDVFVKLEKVCDKSDVKLGRLPGSNEHKPAPSR